MHIDIMPPDLVIFYVLMSLKKPVKFYVKTTYDDICLLWLHQHLLTPVDHT